MSVFVIRFLWTAKRFPRASGSRGHGPCSLLVTGEPFHHGSSRGTIKRWKPKASPGLVAPGAGGSLGPGGLKVPAHGGASFVDRAGNPAARRALQCNAAPVTAPAHGPAEDVHPDGEAGWDAPIHGIVGLGPVKGCPPAHATGPAAQAGVLLRNP